MYFFICRKREPEQAPHIHKRNERLRPPCFFAAVRSQQSEMQNQQ